MSGWLRAVFGGPLEYPEPEECTVLGGETVPCKPLRMSSRPADIGPWEGLFLSLGCFRSGVVSVPGFSSVNPTFPTVKSRLGITHKAPFKK